MGFAPSDEIHDTQAGGPSCMSGATPQMLTNPPWLFMVLAKGEGNLGSWPPVHFVCFLPLYTISVCVILYIYNLFFFIWKKKCCMLILFHNVCAHPVYLDLNWNIGTLHWSSAAAWLFLLENSEHAMFRRSSFTYSVFILCFVLPVSVLFLWSFVALWFTV